MLVHPSVLAGSIRVRAGGMRVLAGGMCVRAYAIHVLAYANTLKHIRYYMWQLFGGLVVRPIYPHRSDVPALVFPSIQL